MWQWTWSHGDMDIQPRHCFTQTCVATLPCCWQWVEFWRSQESLPLLEGLHTFFQIGHAASELADVGL